MVATPASHVVAAIAFHYPELALATLLKVLSSGHFFKLIIDVFLLFDRSLALQARSLLMTLLKDDIEAAISSGADGASMNLRHPILKRPLSVERQIVLVLS